MSIRNLSKNSVELEVEVYDELLKLPFNTSLVGFSMLTEAIIQAVKIGKNARLNMCKEIYEKIAIDRNIAVNSVEKAIKMAINSINNSPVPYKDVNCSSMLIKNALLDGKPKHFIMAVCESLRINSLKSQIA